MEILNKLTAESCNGASIAYSSAYDVFLEQKCEERKQVEEVHDGRKYVTSCLNPEMEFFLNIYDRHWASAAASSYLSDYEAKQQSHLMARLKLTIKDGVPFAEMVTVDWAMISSAVTDR